MPTVQRRPQTWDILQQVLDNVTFTDDSGFELHRDDASNCALLKVLLHVPNTYRPDRADRYSNFEFQPPLATYNYDTWRRWLWGCVSNAWMHEAREWFMDQGVRVYAPHHGSGEDPYLEWHMGTPAQAALAPGQS